MIQELKFDPVKLQQYFRMSVRKFKEAAGFMFDKEWDIALFNVKKIRFFACRHLDTGNK